MKTSKLIITVLVAFLTVQVNAISEKVKGNGKVITETRTTGSYDKISIGGSFKVELVSGKEGNITIKIEENLAKYLITEVKDGSLKVKWKKGVSISHKKEIHITIPFTDIEAISLGGSGSITSKSTVKSDVLKINLAGSGNMNLDVDSGNLDANIAGSGSMKLKGSTNSLNCNISGSGNFNSYELNAGDTDTKISGSGNIKVTVNGKLNARISGSGNIRYDGSPTTESIKVNGSGNVSKR